ncbi:MAG: phage head closure protein [Pseudomonadota bacterium]
MAALKAGSLNRRVTIKAQAAGQDDIGQPVQTWSDIAPVWANVRFKSGSEALRGDKETSVTAASIRIRRRTDVSVAMRVYDGAVIYEIKAVLPDEERRDRLHLVCEVING